MDNWRERIPQRVEEAAEEVLKDLDKDGSLRQYLRKEELIEIVEGVIDKLNGSHELMIISGTLVYLLEDYAMFALALLDNPETRKEVIERAQMLYQTQGEIDSLPTTDER